MDPKPELTSLPDVPSRAIVSLLPLQQLIATLPLLHSRFNLIRKSVLKSNQRFVLYIGDLKKIKIKKCLSQLGIPFASHLVDSNGCPLYPDTSFHRLHQLTLNQHSVEQLSTLMPNLTYLEVAIASVDLSVIPHLITLLTFWGPTLKTLKLLIREFVSPNEEYLQQTYLSTVASHLRPLIRLINSQLLALESLSLDLDDSLVDRYKDGLSQKMNCAVADVIRFQNGYIDHPEIQAIDMDDALRRLNLLLQEAATFLNQEPPAEAVTAEEVLAQELNLMLQLLRNDRFTSEKLFKGETTILGQLKEFSFDTGRHSPSMQAFLLQALEKYGSNQLTSISIAGANSRGKDWKLPAFTRSPFASRFTRFPLSSGPGEDDATPLLPAFANLNVYPLDWFDLTANQMARLCALASLPNLQCLEVDGFNRDTPLLNASFAILPPFSSLTVMEISIYHFARDPYQTHECFQVPYWAHLFPSVQIIKITHSGPLCMRCFPNVRMQYSLKMRHFERQIPCLKRLFAPLRALPSLRKIFYQQIGHIDVTVEFTPQGELAQTHGYVY